MSKPSKPFVLPEDAQPVDNFYHVMVTPELAAELLQKRKPDSKFRDELVETYASLYRVKLWSPLLSILVMVDDVLVDGINQLQAVCDTGIAVPMDMVVHNDGKEHHNWLNDDHMEIDHLISHAKRYAAYHAFESGEITIGDTV